MVATSLVMQAKGELMQAKEDDVDPDFSNSSTMDATGLATLSTRKLAAAADLLLNTSSRSTVTGSDRHLLDGLPVVATPAPLRIRMPRSILVKEAATTQQQKIVYRVSFANTYVREYARTVGDNPSCSSGAPLAISWDYSETRTMPVDLFEESGRRCRTFSELIVSREERERLLKEDWDMKPSQLAQAIRETYKIKNSRRTCVHNFQTAAGKLEASVSSSSVWSSLKRSLAGSSDQRALVLRDQQEKAAAQQQRLWLEQEKKRRSRLALQRRSLSLARIPQDDDDDIVNDDEARGENGANYAVRSRPIEYNDLLITMEIDHDGTKSILKKKNRPTRLRSNSTDTDDEEEERHQTKASVSFATDASSKYQKVWCVTKEFEKVNDSSLWWSEDDMEGRCNQDMDVVDLVRPQMGKLLTVAYESTKSCGSDAGKVALDFHKMSLCWSMARGLEGAVVRELRSRIIKTHAKAVMIKQNALLKEGISGDPSESIRKGSQKFSRASRLIALKMGAFDRLMIVEAK